MSDGTPTFKRVGSSSDRWIGNSLRMAGFLLGAYWLAIFTLTHLPRLPRTLPRVDDKLAHFGAYFVLTILMCHTTSSANRMRRFTVIGIVATLYGAIDEWTQSWVPNRCADLWDFSCDVAGVLLAIGTYIAAKAITESVTWQRNLGRLAVRR